MKRQDVPMRPGVDDKRVMETFGNDLAAVDVAVGPDVLVATDANSEGIDLHLWCRILVNYELDAYPVRIVQRNGAYDVSLHGRRGRDRTSSTLIRRSPVRVTSDWSTTTGIGDVWRRRVLERCRDKLSGINRQLMVV